MQLVDQLLRRADPRLGLRGARFRAAAQPFHLPAHEIGQRLLVRGLVSQQLVALLQKLAVPPLDLQQPLGVHAIELQHAPRDVLQEVAVVTDDHERLRLAFQERLQPEDRFHVEMVGRLVEQQDVRLESQFARDGQPLPPTAGERVGGNGSIGEAGFAEGAGDARGFLVVVERLLLLHGVDQDVFDRHPRREDRILRHVADAHTSAHRARAGVGLLEAGDDFEQCRLARSVRTDETDVIAGSDGEAEVFEERPRGERLRQRFAGKKDLTQGLRCSSKNTATAALVTLPSATPITSS